ncbi:LOW QUALITY PROTEIN: putative inner membrane protein [Pseudomonas aeruginosa 39016]|nr:LOW QUALITY PROTEIN: putative inner membrane protein [Pseudomonas aeruginosa 39016]
MQARSGGIGHGRAIVVESADFARVGPRALTGRPSIGPCRGGSDPGGRHCSRAPAPH